MSLVRDPGNNHWRVGAAAVGAVSLVLAATSAAKGDWPVMSFFALAAVEMLSIAASGVFIGEAWLGWTIHGWVRRIAIADVQAVEVIPPPTERGRIHGVILWVDDRPILVDGIGHWRSAERARDFATRLTVCLQARGGDAGMHDAINDEWPIPPRSERHSEKP